MGTKGFRSFAEPQGFSLVVRLLAWGAVGTILGTIVLVAFASVQGLITLRQL